MRKRFALDSASLVVEVASNDGYLLQHFVADGIPVLGVEPAANTAEAARAKNVPTDVAFFGAETAARLAANGVAADLIAANNVLAHVPDILDFVTGFRDRPEARRHGHASNSRTSSISFSNCNSTRSTTSIIRICRSSPSSACSRRRASRL